MLPYQLLRTAAESEVKGEPLASASASQTLDERRRLCHWRRRVVSLRLKGGHRQHAADVFRQAPLPQGAFSAGIFLRAALSEPWKWKNGDGLREPRPVGSGYDS